MSSSGANQYPVPRKYIDEAVGSDGESKVREGFARKIARIATDNPVVNLAREAYRYMTDPRLPTRTKVMVIASLIYFMTPIDAVPDGIPGLGYVDDLTLISPNHPSLSTMIGTANPSLLAMDSSPAVI